MATDTFLDDIRGLWDRATGKLIGYVDKNADEQSMFGDATAIAAAALAGMNSRFVAPSGDTTGVTDSAVIAAAITAAGVGGAVWLSAGSTYYVDRGMTLLTGQHLIANGATIKRVAQPSSATSTTITSGVTTSVTVADGTQFKVGQQVTFLNGSTYSNNCPTVSGISGNVLSLAGVFDQSSSGAATIYVTYNLMEVAANCRIFDLKTDGNRANFTFGRWQNTSELHVNSGGVLLADYTSINAPGEVIQEGGGVSTSTATAITSGSTVAITVSDVTQFAVGDYIYAYQGSTVDKKPRLISTIVGSVVTVSTAFDIDVTGTTVVYKARLSNRYIRPTALDSSGNAVHLSGSVDTLVEYPTFRRNNLDTAVAHANGAVAFSNSISGFRLIGGVISDNPVAAVGGFGGRDHSDFEWRDTQVNDCLYALNASGAGNNADGFTIDGVTAYRCASGFAIANTTANSTRVTNGKLVNIRGNESLLSLIRVSDIDIIGCDWILAVTEHTNNCVNIDTSERVNVVGGSGQNGDNAVYVSGTADAVKIGAGFRVLNNYSHGIYHNATGSVIVDGAVVRNTASSSKSDYIGIITKAGGPVMNCDVNITTTTGKGVLLNSDGAAASGNTVRVTGGGTTVHAGGGTTGMIAIGNMTRNITAGTDGLNNGGGGSNTFSGNVLLAA